MTWICAALSDADRVVARSRAAAPRRGRHPGADARHPARHLRPRLQQRGQLGPVVPAPPALRHPQPAAVRPRVPPRLGVLRRLQRDVRRRPGPGGRSAGGQAGPGAGRAACGSWSRTTTCAWPRGCCGSGWATPPATAGIGYFCHTPWAPPDYYRMLPDDIGRALLDGILGADRAGFPRRAVGHGVHGLLRRPPRRRRGAGRGGPGRRPAGRVTYRGHVTEVARPPARRGRGRPAGARPGRRTSGRTPASCARPRAAAS